MYIFETIFDSLYLIAVVILGVITWCRAHDRLEFRIFGIAAILLGCGDAFHLIPRIISMNTAGGFDANVAALGAGQLVTSITMTVFYLLLYAALRARYNIKGERALTGTMIGLAVIRIVLCLMPQNAWVSANAPLSWGIYRNIPFAIMGVIIIVLFFRHARAANDVDFKFMWLAIALSFGFYIPVVLFAGTFPPIGALMLPKTLAYVWIVLMGFRAARKA
ncbi:MAG: hypothetical protein RSC43_05695 [Clostridia bacterium]